MCIVQQLLRGVQSYWVLKFFWATMGVTFVASLIVCFTECQPFSLYWQVIPDPGKHQLRPSFSPSHPRQDLSPMVMFMTVWHSRHAHANRYWQAPAEPVTFSYSSSLFWKW